MRTGRPLVTTCKSCGAPRMPGCKMVLCESCWQAYSRQSARESYYRRHPRPAAVSVVALDWRDNQLVHLSATVTGTQPMPATYGDLKTLLAQLSRQGVMIAEHKSYKETDLPASVAKGLTHG